MLWKEIRSRELGGCVCVVLKMCCTADGEDRSTSAESGSDLDLFCGCTVAAVPAYRTKPQGSQDEGVWRGRAEKSRAGKCCCGKPELQMA